MIDLQTRLNEIEKTNFDRLGKLRTTGIWIPWNSSKRGRPDFAVVGGSDDYGDYIVIRVWYNENLIPGKYCLYENKAYISYDREEHLITGEFEVK